MLGDVQQTAYDLRFSIFGIPVRVHPLFWVVAAFLTWEPQRIGLVLVGIACIFLSILVHEMGHALTARHFGWPPRVLLYHFGGLAFYNPQSGHSPQRSILISLAGPGAGFLLFGLVWALQYAIVQFGDPHQLSEAAWRAIEILLWINLVWGLINLLPVYPLDGGQVSRALFTWLKPSGGIPASLKLSIVTGGAGAVLFAVGGLFFAAIFFGGFAYQSYQQLQQYKYGRQDW